MFTRFLSAFTVFLAFLCSVSSADAMGLAFPANGLYSLRPKYAPGFELTVQNASQNQKANVVIWSANSHLLKNSHQRWKIERIGDSNYYKICAENSGLALSLEGEVAATNICVWPYVNQRNQQFAFWDCGDGSYIIQIHLAGRYVLDVDHGGAFDGANVLVYGYHGLSNQRWKLVKL